MVHFRDFHLVDSYLQGNEDAGRELFEPEYEQLARFLHAKFKGLSQEIIDDTIAEAMCRCVEKLDRYTGESSFHTFLCGFTKNVAREATKKSNKEVPSEKVIELADIAPVIESDLSPYSFDPETIVIQKENRERMERALSLLRGRNEDHYNIIVLRILNELPFSQISKLTGESVSALESRFRRALISLKEVIENI